MKGSIEIEAFMVKDAPYIQKIALIRVIRKTYTHLHSLFLNTRKRSKRKCAYVHKINKVWVEYSMRIKLANATLFLMSFFIYLLDLYTVYTLYAVGNNLE